MNSSVSWHQIQVRPFPWQGRSHEFRLQSTKWNLLGSGGEGFVYAFNMHLSTFVDKENFVIKVFSTDRSSKDTLTRQGKNVQALLQTMCDIRKENNHFASLWRNVSFPVAWFAESPNESTGDHGPLTATVLIRAPRSAAYEIGGVRYPATLDCLLKPGWHVSGSHIGTSPMSVFNQYSEEQTWYLLRTLSRAVYGIHSLGAVHGDLSPNNVYIRDPYAPWPEVFIIDAFNGFTEDLQSRPKSAPEILWDQESIDFDENSKSTDVFSVAWWIYLIGIRCKDWSSPDLPDIDQARLNIHQWGQQKGVPNIRRRLADTLILALGPYDYRPSSKQLYHVVHDFFTVLASMNSDYPRVNGDKYAGPVSFAKEGAISNPKGRYVTCTAVAVTPSNRLAVRVPGFHERAFINFEDISMNPITNSDDLLGKKFIAEVKGFDSHKGIFMVSYRSVMESVRSKFLRRVLHFISVGEILEGRVRLIDKKGVLVDVGDYDVFVPSKELAWKPIEHPTEVVYPGEPLRISVSHIDLNSGVIFASRRALVKDPWPRLVTTYHVGETITGNIVSFAQDVAFIRIDSGIIFRLHRIDRAGFNDGWRGAQLGDRISFFIDGFDSSHRLVKGSNS